MGARALSGLLVLPVSACLATEPFGGGADGALSDGGIPGEGAYCAVAREIFIPKCTACHQPGGQTPDLTFQGAQASLVGVASRYGAIRVVARDAAGSLLYRKVSGAQAAGEGDPMPPTTMLSAADLGRIEAWIRDGASFDCTVPGDTDGGTGRYHPEGFASPAVHGTELKLQAEDCRACHGTDLTGSGTAPSCDSCHPSGWRTRCTFCHGGAQEMSGAPPRDLTGATERDQLTFRPHQDHIAGTLHPAYDCTECHEKPTDVLSTNHVFDSTPGHADVTFGGLSAEGRYAGSGQCSNLYCHGNGRGPNGSAVHTAAPPGCGDCHAGPASGRTGWRTMSGEHSKHLEEGVSCAECHAATADVSSQITGPGNHVNGRRDIAFSGTMSRSGASCSGTCHSRSHNAELW